MVRKSNEECDETAQLTAPVTAPLIYGQVLSGQLVGDVATRHRGAHDARKLVAEKR